MKACLTKKTLAPTTTTTACAVPAAARATAANVTVVDATVRLVA